MELKKIPHYVRRVAKLGLKTSAQIVYNRWQEKRFNRYWRVRAKKHNAHHSWLDVQKQFLFDEPFEQWHTKNAHRILLDAGDVCPGILKENILAAAAEYAEQTFSVLGSDKKKFDHVPWHHDIRLLDQDKHADAYFDAKLYYKDFVIIPSATAALNKDIKIPWELSRLQHFFVFGLAYQNSHCDIFLKAFEHQFLDWFEKNPFLLGSHWACPMDVGIRSVNLVWAYSFFKHALSPSFWEKYTALLYDHFFYLEHNWEVYDSRTSNHYLSDLIGYLYLCYFFWASERVQQKAAWCFQTLLQEFEKQVMDDGTDYEGSTSYHKLVTEIFFHMEFLAKKMGFSLPDSFVKKFTAMFTFIDACKPYSSDKGIKIGDNDSGKIIFFGLTEHLIQKRVAAGEKKEIIHYKNFGVSIFKNSDWHISLRHHVYNARQPSGHFHCDVASVTLTHKNVPIFVDSGTYLYTPSEFWRNKFRAASAHSTFYLKNQPYLIPDQRLFLLDIPERSFVDGWQTSDDSKTLATFHTLYNALGITAYRSITVHDAMYVSIADWFVSDECQTREWEWSFMLHPAVVPRKDGEKIMLLRDGKYFGEMSSLVPLSIEEAFYSPAYGLKVATKKLYGCVGMNPAMQIRTTLSIIDT